MRIIIDKTTHSMNISECFVSVHFISIAPPQYENSDSDRATSKNDKKLLLVRTSSHPRHSYFH